MQFNLKSPSEGLCMKQKRTALSSTCPTKLQKKTTTMKKSKEIQLENWILKAYLLSFTKQIPWKKKKYLIISGDDFNRVCEKMGKKKFFYLRRRNSLNDWLKKDKLSFVCSLASWIASYSSSCRLVVFILNWANIETCRRRRDCIVNQLLLERQYST